MKKYACYQKHRDEESGEWWRTFEGHVLAETPEEAAKKGKAAFGFVEGEQFAAFEVGTRVNLRGWLSRAEKERLLTERFDAMGLDEQDAYIGR